MAFSDSEECIVSSTAVVLVDWTRRVPAAPGERTETVQRPPGRLPSAWLSPDPRNLSPLHGMRICGIDHTTSIVSRAWQLRPKHLPVPRSARCVMPQESNPGH
jgi:hypothetical protein